MLSAVGISPNHWLRCSALIPPLAFVTSSALSQVSTFHSSSSFNRVLHSKLKYNHRASSEGLPNELVEDSKFVPLNADDRTYGPPALLLLGFDADEGLKIQQLLKELDGEFMKVIYCTEDMVTSSLWEAMHTTQPSLEKIKIDKSLPRICFLSGLSGEEMMMFIDAFPETETCIMMGRKLFWITSRGLLEMIMNFGEVNKMKSNALKNKNKGLKPAVFAALVPNSADKPLQELIEEIMGDHEMLSSKQPNSD